MTEIKDGPFKGYTLEFASTYHIDMIKDETLDKFFEVLDEVLGIPDAFMSDESDIGTFFDEGEEDLIPVFAEKIGMPLMTSQTKVLEILQFLERD